MSTAIVLDGSQRSALAVVRSLGQRGLRIVVCSTRAKSLAGSSRWCAQSYVVPDANNEPDDLIPALEEIVRQEKASIVFPVTDGTTMTLVKRSKIADALIACPSETSYEAVTDKGRLFQRASELGIPVPLTRKIRNAEEFRASLLDWSGPVVIKPARSQYRWGSRIRSTSVLMADDPDHALAMLSSLDWLGHVSCLLQKFIPGHGAGMFTVYGPAGPVSWFSHTRIREKPPSGGVSVLCESVPIDAVMQKYAKCLLDDAKWLGPAMVEFRVDPEGQPWLMEINGRFWGSLQLSIDSGLDLPWVWHQIMTEASPQPAPAYQVGKRLRWLLGDLDSLYLTLRDRRISLRERLLATANFMNFFSRNTRLEVLRFSDARPFIYELKSWLRSIFRRKNKEKATA